MMISCFTTEKKSAIPIILLNTESLPLWLTQQTVFIQKWIKQQNFSGNPNSFCCIPGTDGAIAQILLGTKNNSDFFAVGSLPMTLPPATYSLATWHQDAALAWGLGAYQFTQYKKSTKPVSQLYLPENENHEDLLAKIKAIYLTRSLINTPAEAMGPLELYEKTAEIARIFGAECNQISGEELLLQNYPAIHAVGRASVKTPRLIDLRWGDKKFPKVTLVGKGVCFDSGGLNLKTAGGMLLMKKDMGGAANILGLAFLIMQAKLPVCLRVLIPAVENAVSGNAYRPGDIINTRKGLTVEITNTDAEGRLVLADALAEASSESPELLIDMATLTGAARVAMGTELPAFFTNDDRLASALIRIGDEQNDPLWRMPLYAPYRKLLESSIADMNNAPNSPYAGAITAALFLQSFVDESIRWIHIDLMAWNVSTTPARPEGGEAMGIRTLFAYLQEQFGSMIN